ncbi:MAG TPA: hypothetical protein VJI13_04705 [Candidatus Norongarragalinales archaeon]|nr:hypothetical protein [Candidatus Norongarragalinales archaeon]
MDVTFRKIDSAIFRKFKARCAEIGISMGEGFNQAGLNWLGEVGMPAKLAQDSSKDIHMLTDLGAHIHNLHQAHLETEKKRKRTS